MNRIAIIVALFVVGVALMTSLTAVVIAVTRGRPGASQGARRPPPDEQGPEA